MAAQRLHLSHCRGKPPAQALDAPEVHSTGQPATPLPAIQKPDQPWDIDQTHRFVVAEPALASIALSQLASKAGSIAGFAGQLAEIGEHQGPGCAGRASSETIAADAGSSAITITLLFAIEEGRQGPELAARAGSQARSVELLARGSRVWRDRSVPAHCWRLNRAGVEPHPQG